MSELKKINEIIDNMTVEEKCENYCSYTLHCKELNKTKGMRILCERPNIYRQKERLNEIARSIYNRPNQEQRRGSRKKVYRR